MQPKLKVWCHQFWGKALITDNRPLSYSEKESQSNDTLLHFAESSNVHNSDSDTDSTVACSGLLFLLIGLTWNVPLLRIPHIDDKLY